MSKFNKPALFSVYSNNSFSNLTTLLSSSNCIAVVGKMASGKNYICSLLEKQGWKSLDADLLVHQAINNATSTVYETFKDEAQKLHLNILNEDKTINRRELGKLLFSRPDLMKKQEAIVYPEITKLVKDFVQENSKTIINATVLFNTPELIELCDYILYVKAPFFKRLIRAKKRDNLSYKQIFKRFYSQKDLYSRYKNCKKTLILIKN